MGVHASFPMHLWCRLLPSAEMQLNLLHHSSAMPKISAYAHVHGPHNFMKRSLAPLGCPVQVHVKPDKIGSWSEHSIDAWNLGPSKENHRFFHTYNKHTRAERIADQLFFNHHYLTKPQVRAEVTIVEAMQHIQGALEGSSKGESFKMEELKRAASILDNIAQARAQIAKAKTIINNGIKTHQDKRSAAPRVETLAVKASSAWIFGYPYLVG